MSSERVKLSRRAALAALPGVRLTRAVAAEQVRSSNASANGKGTTPPVLGNLFETLATYAREAPPSYAYDPHPGRISNRGSGTRVRSAWNTLRIIHPLFRWTQR